MSASPSKGDLRKIALATRDAMDDASRAAASEKVAVRGLPFEIAAGTVVSGYSPIRSEFDPAPLMRRLAEIGAKLALPAVLGRGKSLVFALGHQMTGSRSVRSASPSHRRPQRNACPTSCWCR